jgi:hypothetical protein
MIPRMATQRFYLLGEDASTAREIQVTSDTDLEDLQEIVASHFGIVEPKGTLTPAVNCNLRCPANKPQGYRSPHRM